MRWPQKLWYDFTRSGAQVAFTLAWSLRFEGSRHLPRRGPVLLVANHQSFLDPPAVGIAASPRRLCFLARKGLFQPRLFGAYLRSLNCVPVDQEGVAKEGLKTVLDRLAAGEGVLVFPEGERSWKGPMQPLKPGVVLLVKRSLAPVVPVGIAGAYELYPRTIGVPRFAPLMFPSGHGGLAVSFGPPLDPHRLAALPREELLAELFRAIHEQKERAERLRRKP
jgi:1-acyl-sn-glycerol-3-phosphate acyltransferase